MRLYKRQDNDTQKYMMMHLAGLERIGPYMDSPLVMAGGGGGDIRGCCFGYEEEQAVKCRAYKQGFLEDHT